MGGIGSVSKAQGGQQMDTSGSSSSGGGGGQQIKLESSEEGGDDLEQQLKSVFLTDSEEGVSIEDACERVPNYTMEQIRAKVHNMAQDGHIYSTIDEEHYKSTG